MNAYSHTSAQLRQDARDHGAYAPLIAAARDLLVSWDFHRAGRATLPEFEALRTAVTALGAGECPICAGTQITFGKRCHCAQEKTP